MKRSISIIILIFLISLPAVVQAGMQIPVPDLTVSNGMAAEHSPVIDDNWTLDRYYIYSDDAGLKTRFGVNHEFRGAFSTHLTQKQAAMLEAEGVGVEPVQIYHITGRPVCGDGICQGKESSTCPSDCQSTPPPPDSSRTCFPDNQYPWGIQMLNGGGSAAGAGVTVAVIDTGVKADHPDLAANVLSCKDTTRKGLRDGCSDGVGHGTHVAGTILGNGGQDGLGIYGVAPGAGLIAVKVCGSSFCWGDDIAEGIAYATDAGANIISMSLGGDLPDPVLLSEIDYAVGKGVLVVAAAGNDGPADGSIDYPGAYYKVVAVGAIDSGTQVPNWSSRGLNNGDLVINEKEVEFGAPGVLVESTYKDGCYAYMSGTSMATPHVSGLAAKLWQGSAGTTRAYLKSRANDIWQTGFDTATGFGLPSAP